MGQADLKERLKHLKKQSRRSQLCDCVSQSCVELFLTDRFADAESTLQRASERKLEELPDS